MSRTDKGSVSLEEGFWHIKAEPHIIARLANTITRTQPLDRTTARLKATDEASKDLDWFLQRYRLNVLSPDEMALRVARYHEVQEQMDHLHENNIDLTKFKMAKPPREYQAKTIEMLKLRGGILCADVVGLGNTIC